MTNEVEQIVNEFQRSEISLLQSEKYGKWLELLSPDIRYIMPITENVRGEPANQTRGMVWCDDDFRSLSIKVRRMESGLAVGHTTPVRLRYFVQNLRFHREADRAIYVTSNLLIHKSQSDAAALFAAGREDELVRIDERWVLQSRLIHLDQTVRGIHTHQDVFF